MHPATPSPQAGDGSVTWIVTHRVRPERRSDLEAWLHGIQGDLERHPGHLGTTFLRPRGPAGGEYVVIVRFAAYDDLRRWEDSPERAAWVAKLPPLLAGEPAFDTQTGLESWLDLGAPAPVESPPKYKLAVLVGLAIYPLLVTVVPILGWLLGDYPFLATPVAITPELFTRSLLNVAILVPLMTWVALPNLTRLLRPWLHSSH
jgi:antibiotic biosynthesis monooxygenase (ABM) superfamily enzyme